MAILENVELWFAKINPKRPNARFNKKNPTWECQIRTYDKEQKKEWETVGLKVKDVIPDKDGEKPYYRVNLRKKSIKEDGEPSSFVKLVDGDLEPVDPDTIGNGSLGNVRIYQYEYENEGEKGVASILMGIQLTKHIIYKMPPREDEFEKQEKKTVTIVPEGMETPEKKDDDDFEKSDASTPAPSVSSSTSSSTSSSPAPSPTPKVDPKDDY
jgi:hypothetical protein